MSEKHDQEYLADGMAEEILNLLAQVPDLLVLGADLVVLFQRQANEDPRHRARARRRARP